MSEALLGQQRMQTAFARADRQLRVYERRREVAFRHYLAEECHIDSDVYWKEVADAIAKLACAWG